MYVCYRCLPRDIYVWAHQLPQVWACMECASAWCKYGNTKTCAYATCRCFLLWVTASRLGHVACLVCPPMHVSLYCTWGGTFGCSAPCHATATLGLLCIHPSTCALRLACLQRCVYSSELRQGLAKQPGRPHRDSLAGWQCRGVAACFAGALHIILLGLTLLLAPHICCLNPLFS